jgi:hypothetical protein
MSFYDEWKNEMGYDPFNIDGILNNDKWNNAPTKIMFLAKESYGDYYPQRGQEIPIDGGKNKSFWWNVARWKHLIFKHMSGDEHEEFPNIEDLKEVKNGSRCLDDIAWVNIKKKLGGSKSNMTEIHQFAEKDKEFLEKQFAEINPEVVLCCGTFYAYKIVYSHTKDIVKISDGIYKHGSRLIIEFYHPGYFAYKGGQSGLYRKLSEILKAYKF